MLLSELREAYLYHWMDRAKVESVLEHDAFTRLWQHDTPEGTYNGVSFSRNPHFTYGEKAVRLTLDKRKLASRYKIIPLDAERAFGKTISSYHWWKRNDRQLNNNGQQYAEEFVLGQIKDLHRYLVHIDVSKHAAHQQVRSLVSQVEAYAKKWNIPLTIAPEIKNQLERLNAEED